MGNLTMKVAPAPEVDYKDRWLRAEAELQNVRKRARRDVDDARRSAEEAVLLDLVSWLDDLERAVDAARSSDAAVLEIDPPENVVGGTVVQVIAKGYRRGTRPLRAARVVVARESGNA